LLLDALSNVGDSFYITVVIIDEGLGLFGVLELYNGILKH